MIEHDLGIAGPAVSMERRLDVACTLVHALVARPAREAPGAGEEARELLETLALPAAVFDAAGRAPRLANRAWTAPPGARARAPLGPHIEEVIRTGVARYLADLALDAPPARCAAALRPIRDRAGATIGAIVVCAPITDEVVARELGAGADALVWGGPVCGGPDYANRAWRAYTGAKHAVSRLHWQHAIHAADLPRCMLAFGDAARSGAAEVEARVRRADGEHRRHRIRFVLAPRGRWFGVATDVEDARAEAERDEVLARERAARAEAEQASRIKDQLLAAVSHELRAPLTAMLMWEQVLRDEHADAALRAQALEAVHQSALSQSRLVGDLLDVSRAMRGKLHVDLRPLDLERVLCGAVEAIAPAALAKGIALERRGAPVDAVVQGDDARLRQVLDNLLANAVKFTEAGGRVTIAVAREGSRVVISVEDSGCGIAPESLPHLFKPFSQIGDSGLPMHGGLGLGLAIAKQIVDLHHGELTAASAGRGRGATFTVKLPAEDQPRVGSPPGGIARRPTLARTRVLLVDDDPGILEVLGLLLEHAGAVVDTAESAEAARAKLATQPPEVLICDIAMPHEDGNTLIRSLRASGQRIPAIALTAYTTESDVERALAAGFDRHAAKPIDLERLVEDIGTLAAHAPARSLEAADPRKPISGEIA